MKSKKNPVLTVVVCMLVYLFFVAVFLIMSVDIEDGIIFNNKTTARVMGENESQVFTLDNGIKLVSNSVLKDGDYTFSLSVDGKVVYQRYDTMLEVKNVYAVNKTDFVVGITDIAEGLYTGYVLFYGDKHSSIDLSVVTKFNDVKDFKINDIIFTIKSTKSHSFLDVACSKENENDIYGVTEEFKYLGNGKLELVKIVEEVTLLDLVKQEGYKNCKDLIK